MFKLRDRVKRKDGKCEAGMVVEVSVPVVSQVGAEEPRISYMNRISVRISYPTMEEYHDGDDVWTFQDPYEWELL